MSEPLDICTTELARIGAKLNAVLTWATGRCECCAGMTDDKCGERVYTERCYGCAKYSGEEDAPMLWRGAWEDA